MNQLGSPELVVNHLLGQIDRAEPNSYYFAENSWRSVLVFFLNSGFYSSLVSLIIRQISRVDLKVHWDLLLSAILRGGDFPDKWPQGLKENLYQGIKDTNCEDDILILTNHKKVLPEIRTSCKDREEYMQKQVEFRRTEMLGELLSLRAQQLFDAESRLLKKLQKAFVNDPDVKKQERKHQELHAFEILAKWAPNRKSRKLDPGVEILGTKFVKELEEQAILEGHLLECTKKSILDQLPQNAEIAADFVMLFIFLEDFERASQLLDIAFAKNCPLAMRWIQVELLILRRRFVDVLDLIAKLEFEFAENPETFFATTYFRAQAFWGLGQKASAIEVLEILVATRPQYRSALGLLNQWRSV